MPIPCESISQPINEGSALKARQRSTLLALPLVLALAWPSASSAESATPLEFKPGNPKMATLLTRLSATRELAAEPFSVAMVDLNGDGRHEIVVRSDGRGFCGSGGCLTVVLEQQGAAMVTLLNQNLFPGVGVTHDKVGAYRALAALDAGGAIVMGQKPGTPLYGKPLIYPMQAAATAPAATATVAAAATTAMAAPSGDAATRAWLPEVLGFKLGMDLQDVRTRMAALRLSAATVPRARTSVGEYTPGFMAMDQGAAETSEAGIFNFTFTTPPSADKLVFVERQVRYDKMPGKAPVAAELKTALSQKFGPPTMRQALASNIERITWIWSPTGQLQKQGLGMSCDSLASSFTTYSNQIPMIDAAQAARLDKLMQSGCGVWMQATVTHAASGVVTSISHHAIDVAGGIAARLATTAAIGDQSRRKQQQDLDQARQQKPKI